MKRFFRRKKKISLFSRASGTKILTGCAVFLLFCLSPLANLFVSLCVMGVYSRMNEKESLIATESIRLHIPGGFATAKSDWYPFVMNYCADSDFRHYMGNPDLSLTILYNFPAFSLLRGCSHLYDTKSPYYNSFYGAYLIKDASGRPFGFVRDDFGTYHPNAAEAALIPEYDFFRLVLIEFGISEVDSVFDWTVTDLIDDQTYAGESGFTRMDATLTVNGSSHIRNGFTPSYLQYGSPHFSCQDPLAPVRMYGRLYGKYLEDKQVSLFFYIVAADEAALEECDRLILSKSRLIP